MSWEDLLASGREHRAAHPGAVADRMAAAPRRRHRDADLHLGHDRAAQGRDASVANVEFAIQTLVDGGGFASPPPGPGDLMLSYLPLCHVAERIFTTWFNAGAGVQVNFAESIATVQAEPARGAAHDPVRRAAHLGEDPGRGQHPAGQRVAGQAAQRPAVAAAWPTGSAPRWCAPAAGTPPAPGCAYAIGWVFFYRALRERIGMRRVRYAASGAAPIAPEVLRFFMGIGVPMHEVYGMTENTAVATGNRPGRVRLGTVGEPQAGVELRIDEETGEILTRHAGTFVGYFRDPEATARAMTPDGWLHTGDVGEWVDGTHVRITDRAKDIIITSGGKNIAPSEIENALKASPYIKEAIVIGDRRPFLAALIGIELDTVGEWAQRRGIAYTTYRDLSEKPEVLALVQSIVDDVNAALRPRRAGQEVPHAAQGARPRGRRADRDPEGQALGRRRRCSPTWSTTMYAEATAMTELRRERPPRASGIGSVYALLALGFVIIYKATRVISFAQPAFMLAGVVLVTYLVGPLGFWVALPLAALVHRRAGAGRRAGRGAARWSGGRRSPSRSSRSASTSRSGSWSTRFIGIDVRQVGDPWGLRRPVDLLGGRGGAAARRDGRHDRGAGHRAVRVLPVHPDGAGDAGGRLRPGGGAGAGRLGRRGLRAVLGARRRAGRGRRHVRRGRRRRRRARCGSSRWSRCR